VEFALFGGGGIQAAGGFVEDEYLGLFKNRGQTTFPCTGHELLVHFGSE